MRSVMGLVFLTCAQFACAGPAAIPAAPLPWPEPDKAEVAKLDAELRKELPADTFSFYRVGPWLVTTDLTKEEGQQFVEQTIRRCGSVLQQQLFTKTPRQTPVKVYLFKDGESYTAWNKKLFGERPTTPFGYYSRRHRALVMNIGTGGGTLVHEMVHAMAEADFPEIPAWLNEGLGSLYECSLITRAGRIEGRANWRLAGLLDALAQATAPKFKDLLSLSDNEFYGDNSGRNYAAARYLMQWLQENGKLEAFYTRVRDKKHATPQAALCAVFGDKLTIDELETQCYAWVKTLKAR